ncbi:MAG: bifunctional chorismate mutase/prephenate dehydratase [Synergistaceae bacterium]|nr:bifunctional chorismate mutase/prephenate dehydratase [Synergistaceae bacterium]MBR1603795.1 bifunctional chorismate mutase/prephenate dehydratase [Synergistaceae bacterium]
MDIKDIRGKIDDIDDNILKLFLERMNLMRDVAEYKNARGLPVIDRAREREVLGNILDKAGDELGEYAYYLFSKLISLSCARQNEFIAAPTKVKAQVENSLLNINETFPKTGTVACQGVEGSNAQAACDKILPMGKIMYVNNFKAVFDAVDSGLCKYGVLPIENSTNGSVRPVYDLLLQRKFYIVRGTQLLIQHELLAKKGAKLENIKKIYSHQQALGQCSNYLAKLNFKGVEVLPYGNTATAAKMVAESDDLTIAAIASPECAKLYNLECLDDNIQDSDNNYTRFICIAKEPVIYAGANRLSIILGCGNTPGALYEILSRVAAHGVNMDKLESYPAVGRHFEWMFFLELEASIQEPGILNMLEDLERTCPNFTLLGSYSLV